ncbi:MAG: hypothetical protein WBC18_00260 [Ottowia sp.]|uniref:hypothetical protein n=1 Tax=Ottowia sp. TaxID=1898956 RepID=UPI003C77B1FB
MRSRLTPLRLWLLLFALLGAQALGLVHGVLHAYDAFPASVRTVITRAAQPAGTQALPADAARSWLSHVFSDHSAGQCRLFDQLAHGDQAPLPPAPALPAHAAAPGESCWPPELWVAAELTPFDARAPPAQA